MREQFPDQISEIRQKGLFIGLKFVEDGYGPLMTLATYYNGILAIYADNDRSVLQFLPPLIIGKREVDYILSHMHKALSWAKEHTEYLEIARGIKNI